MQMISIFIWTEGGADIVFHLCMLHILTKINLSMTITISDNQNRDT